jgi:hypothetical protein
LTNCVNPVIPYSYRVIGTMSKTQYMEGCKQAFRGVTLKAEDLLLLEACQIANLPVRAPERELAAVLHARPVIKTFFVDKHPPVKPFIEEVVAQFGPAENDEAFAALSDTLLWSIADLIIYNKCPEVYHAQSHHQWDFGAITSITALDDKVVIDAGAGTGRVALEAATVARYVFAVEPVARLRRFIEAQADQAGLSNIFTLDGFLHAIPLPDDFADVLLTCRAIGWQLEDELKEVERVVRPGGTIVHCTGMRVEAGHPIHERLTSPDWGYETGPYQEGIDLRTKYWKRM